jgi:2-keto-3-deoxy-L-rhamnonate aldolase RhmA
VPVPGAANPLIEKLRDGRRALGTFIFSTDPSNTEIAGLAGLDFAIIDTEHAPLDIAAVTAHVRAAAATGISALVRVGSDDPAVVARFLDAGAQGIVLPHIGLNERATATALDALRYAPDGARPTCTGVKSATYGLGSFADHAARSNREVLSIGLVEDIPVVDRIEELLASHRVDAVMPGPADLATSMGLHGQQAHPDVQAAVRRVIEAGNAADRVKVGVYVSEPTAAAAWAGVDIDFLVLSIDHRVLAQAYASGVEQLRAPAR